MVKTNFGEVMSEKFIHAVKLYLTNSFGNLTSKTSPVYPNSVFYVDSFNIVFIRYFEDSGYVRFDKQITYKLKLLFYLNSFESHRIIIDWLEEHYKLSRVRLSILPIWE
jgi:hypothetical protein